MDNPVVVMMETRIALQSIKLTGGVIVHKGMDMHCFPFCTVLHHEDTESLEIFYTDKKTGRSETMNGFGPDEWDRYEYYREDKEVTSD